MKRFDEDMQRFQRENAQLVKRQNAIVLYGSSTFTRWSKEDIDRDLTGMEVINRGFGDSSAEEALAYFDVAVRSVAPKMMIYYEGANDVARDQTVEESFAYTVKVYEKAKAMNPQMVWVFLLLHMCPGRMEHHASYRELNELYKAFCKEHDRCHWVDINPIIHGEDGRLKQDFYIEDGLHFTPEGYREFGQTMYKKLTNILEEEKS